MRSTVLLLLLLMAASAVAADDNRTVDSLNRLTRQYRGTDNAKAYTTVGQALSISARIGYTMGYAEACRNHANLDADAGRNTEALSWNQQSLNKYLMLADSEYVYLIYYANVYICQGLEDHERALQYGNMCLSYYRRIGNDTMVAGVLHNLSNTSLSVGRTDEAIRSLQEALRINERLHNTDWAARNVFRLASLSEDRDPEAALRWYDRARALFLSVGDSVTYGMSVVGIAIVRMKQKQFYKATHILSHIVHVFRSVRDTNGIAWTYNHLGSCYTQLGRYKEAAVFLDSCLRLCERLHNTEAMRNVYQRLYELDSASGDRASAFFHYQKYIAARDSINNSDKVRKAANQVMRFEFSKRESAARAEQEKKDITERNVRISIIGGIVVALSFLVVVYRQRNRVESEKKRSESLLLNILPAETAHELLTHGHTTARRYDNVTVLFTDFVDFTQYSEGMSPEDLVNELHECFSAFDAIIERHGLEKIKTTGDAYMAVCGMPTPKVDHAAACIRAALEILRYVSDRNAHRAGFRIRSGIHSGSVVAGIVGVRKFTYDIWGDAVNTAARMEQHSEPGKITISEATYTLVHDQFTCTPRGMVDVKGKGGMRLYFVEGMKEKRGERRENREERIENRE